MQFLATIKKLNKKHSQKYGLRENDDETYEVLSGEGVVEIADVVGGMDLLGWGLEVKWLCFDGDLLGLGDRGKDYGLLRMVWRDVNSRGPDWAIVCWRDFGPRRRRIKGGGGAAFAAGLGDRDGGGGGGWGLGGLGPVLMVVGFHWLSFAWSS